MTILRFDVSFSEKNATIFATLGLLFAVFRIKMQHRSEAYVIVSVVALHEKNRHRIQIIKILCPRAAFDGIMVF